MKIYTKKGDSGESEILGGERFSKGHLRFELLGSLDELSSVLGLAQAFDCNLEEELKLLQNTIFDVGALLASPKGDWPKYKLQSPSVELIQRLEKQIDFYMEECPELKNFILPGGTQGAAYVHHARAVCRRCERVLQKHYKSEPTEFDENISKLFNRMSDYFFALARYTNFTNKIEDVTWSKSF